MVCTEVGGEMLCFDKMALAENQGVFDDIFQLSDIAWPGVTQPYLQDLGGKVSEVLTLPIAYLVNEGFGQKGDIVLSFPQGRKGD